MKIARIKAGRKVFYATYDKYGGLSVWSALDYARRRKDSTWYFQNTEEQSIFSENLTETIENLESAGAIR